MLSECRRLLTVCTSIVPRGLVVNHFYDLLALSNSRVPCPHARRGIALILVSVLFLALGCGSTGAELKDKVEVPSSKYVSLDSEEAAAVREALAVIEATDADPTERADAYALVADASLYVW